MQFNPFVMSLSILIVGVILIAAGGLSIKPSNKKAWGTNTVLFFKIGVVLAIIGTILIYAYK